MQRPADAADGSAAAAGGSAGSSGSGGSASKPSKPPGRAGPLTQLRLARYASKGKKLWERYREVAELGDQHEVYLRLSEFLGSFRSTIKEVRANSRDGGVTLDRMFGDCGEIVHALLDYVDRELGASTSAAASSSRSMSLVELIPEALRAAELILSDERYVAAIKDSAATIGRVLSMLERLQSRQRVTRHVS